MDRNELLVFKKPTDAVGSNRGFIYQYLMTLVQWVKNYHLGRNVSLYCEVEDDVKELDEQNKKVKYTQLKCYTPVLSLGHPDVQKSIYNFFVLHLINEDFQSTYLFETNTSVSSRDKLLANWVLDAGNLESIPELMEQCVSKTKEILTKELEKDQSSRITTINNKMKDKRDKIKKETNKKKLEKLTLDFKSDEMELTEYKLKVQEFKKVISDDVEIQNFIVRIRWKFSNITTKDSLKVLEKEALDILSDILNVKYEPKMYFSRLFTEISKKSSSDGGKNRILDNKLLKEILKEATEEMESKIADDLIQLWRDTLQNGIEGIHEHLTDGFNDMHSGFEQIHERFNHVEGLLETHSHEGKSEEYEFVELPYREAEKIDEFIKNEDNDHQSRLEYKIDSMSKVHPDDKKSFLDMGTQYRCRYLIYLEELKLNSTKTAYNAVKILEGKVQKLCTRHTRELDKYDEINSNDAYKQLENELELLLKDFNLEQIRKGLKLDEDIVSGQMFHMASKCYLRWHKEAQAV